MDEAPHTDEARQTDGQVPGPSLAMRTVAILGLLLVIPSIGVLFYLALAPLSPPETEPRHTSEEWRPELERWLQEAQQDGGMSWQPEEIIQKTPVLFPVFDQEPGQYNQYYKNLVHEEGVTWLTDPEIVTDARPLVSVNEWMDSAYTLQFFKIGEDNGNDILLSFIPCDGMCFYDSQALLVFRTSPGGYEFLSSHTERSISESLVFAPGVVVNTERTYKALAVPERLSLSGETVRDGGLNTFFENPERFNIRDGMQENGTSYSTTFVKDTEYGPLFRVSLRGRDTQVQSDYFLLRLAGGIEVTYYQNLPFVGDDRVPAITWTDGTKNSDAYRSDGLGGCGGWGKIEVVNQRAMSTIESELTPVGLTSTNKVIFAPINASHWLIERVFERTGGNYFEYNQATGESIPRTITTDDYHAQHGLVVYKDGFGQLVVLSNTKYGPAVECAKPVIYLYPEEVTSVSVEVGAEITQSDPVYGDGWHVEASPNGDLVVGGKKYESLFWDGYGHGVYPTLTKGAVVARSEVARTIAVQMYQMGFVMGEIEDFLEYWMPLMPDTAYVRLSWLGTQEMNELAPLRVVPEPQTSIRAFLDFEGLDTYEAWEPQLFRKTERKGSTLTEWGGLKRE